MALLGERQSVSVVPRTAQQARWLVPAGLALQATRSFRAVDLVQGVRTGGGVYSWTERLTRRCSRRIRVSHPLPVAGRGWLRTVTRKGRATRPAAERQR